MSEEFYEAVYYISLGVWAALTLLCLAFYVIEMAKAVRVMKKMAEELGENEEPGVKLYDAYASREVCMTAMFILFAHIGLIAVAFAFVPPHTAELTLRALAARTLLLASVFLLLRGYIRWQKFRDDERRQSVYAERLEEVKKSFGV